MSEAIFGKQPCKSQGYPLSSLASLPHTQIQHVSGGVGERLERGEHFPISNPNLGQIQNSTLRAISAPSASVDSTCRCGTLVMSLSHTDTHCIQSVSLPRPVTLPINCPHYLSTKKPWDSLAIACRLSQWDLFCDKSIMTSLPESGQECPLLRGCVYALFLAIKSSHWHNIYPSINTTDVGHVDVVQNHENPPYRP